MSLSGTSSGIDVGEREGPLLAADWTAEEETRARRKVDFILMPLLMLGFFCLQLDRGNIANAITDNFRDDVGITQNQLNVGQQLLSTGIVLLEIPSNMILYRVGPQKWLSLQVVAFGLVSTLQAFQKGYGAFLATRLLLGLTESGYIPGSLYTLTSWYTRKETAKRVMFFFVGNFTAAATTNLISYGILHMRGVGGKPGWFWLFILMGIFSVAAGLVLAALLPDSVHKPSPWLLPRLKYFTDRELYILKHRIILDDPAKASGPIRINGRELLSALRNWRLWPHVLITLSNNGPLLAFNTYAPAIINSFGFARLRSNALASVGPWILIPVSLLFSFFSDKFQWRAGTTTLAVVVNWAFMIMNQQLTHSNSRSRRFAGIVLVQSINFTPHPLNVAWMALHCRSATERAVAMAMIMMSANMAGIYSAQIMRSDDAPRYLRGFTVMVAVVSLALAACLFQWTADAFYARRAARRGEEDIVVRHRHAELKDDVKQPAARTDSTDEKEYDLKRLP